ncbi:MAG: DUF202 domain-containing protein [Bdellovibrionales bacterium]
MDRKDILAKFRTDMANERNLLAYFRTFLSCFGIAIVNWKFQLFESYVVLSWLFIVTGVLSLAFGIWSHFNMKKRISQQMN